MSTRMFVQEIVDSGYVFTMKHAGFKAALKMARRLEDNGSVHGLPAGESIPVFPIACLPGAPKGWVREAGTYVCPVDAEWGLWFDWTMNDPLNTAILPSCKGMNPLTGQKLEGMVLEQFADKCPIHNKSFAHGRHCEECGYEWPPQNWVSHSNTLWWDGFRQPDGSVRQFFFTDEDKRDIATAVIGKKNTVPAFGFAFYQPKQYREPPRPVMRSCSMAFGNGFGGHSFGSSLDYHSTDNMKHFAPTSENMAGAEVAMCSASASASTLKGAPVRSMNMSKLSKSVTSEKKSKSVSVGAGAKIRQELTACSLGIDGWKDQPEAIIRLYFCFEEQFRHIAAKGIKPLVSNSEGYLKDLPVG